MKILKEGRKLDAMLVTCKYYDAELKITSEDVEVRIRNIVYLYPCCRNFNYLDFTKLTEDSKFYLGTKCIGEDRIIYK